MHHVATVHATMTQLCQAPHINAQAGLCQKKKVLTIDLPVADRDAGDTYLWQKRRTPPIDLPVAERDAGDTHLRQKWNMPKKWLQRIPDVHHAN
jgi:hypothetical protein